MTGRVPTQIELEAMGAIRNLQDEIKEARDIIDLLLRESTYGTFASPAWPEARRKAIAFMTYHPAERTVDDDE